MAVKVVVTLRRAVRELEAEKARIERQLDAIRGLLDGLGGSRARAGRGPGGRRRRKRRMSAAARRAASQRMREYWSKRRAQGARRKRGARDRPAA